MMKTTSLPFRCYIRFCSIVLILLAGLIAPACQGAEAQPASGVVSVQNSKPWVEEPPPCRVHFGDYLYIYTINFSAWTNSLPAKYAGQPLVLHLGGQPLPGLHPKFFTEWVGTNSAGQLITRASFGVELERNATNRETWKMLARNPGLELARPLEVSLGYAGGPVMHSWVYPKEVESESPFQLIILARWEIYLGLSVVLGALVIFLLLANQSNILRDPNLPLRPDGSVPFSLARTQMAFWFFLVIGSFFFLWLISKDTATLNSSVLTLISISAATAVSSAFIDTGKRRELEVELLPSEIRSKPHAEILNLLKSGLSEAEMELSKLRAAREQADKLGTPVSAVDERIETALVQRRLRLENQIEYYESPPWKAWVSDILGENGSITFHRFQMVIWTIVLGIIFVREVYSTMAMPEFNATLLGLMGISAGTFIGFKIPDQPKR